MPERVIALVLVAPPVFPDAVSARERLGQRGWLARRVVAGSAVASVTCGLMCLTRPLVARVATRVARVSHDVPDEVARDSVRHSWPAYRDAIVTLLEANPLPAAISHPARPTTVVVSDGDLQAPPQDVTAWPHDLIELVELDGDHLVPLRHPRRLAQIVSDRVRGY